MSFPMFSYGVHQAWVARVDLGIGSGIRDAFFVYPVEPCKIIFAPFDCTAVVTKYDYSTGLSYYKIVIDDELTITTKREPYIGGEGTYSIKAGDIIETYEGYSCGCIDGYEMHNITFPYVSYKSGIRFETSNPEKYLGSSCASLEIGTYNCVIDDGAIQKVVVVELACGPSSHSLVSVVENGSNYTPTTINNVTSSAGTYTFMGWYSNRKLTNEFTGTISDNTYGIVYLYGKWDAEANGDRTIWKCTIQYQNDIHADSSIISSLSISYDIIVTNNSNMKVYYIPPSVGIDELIYVGQYAYHDESYVLGRQGFNYYPLNQGNRLETFGFDVPSPYVLPSAYPTFYYVTHLISRITLSSGKCAGIFISPKDNISDFSLVDAGDAFQHPKSNIEWKECTLSYSFIPYESSLVSPPYTSNNYYGPYTQIFVFGGYKTGGDIIPILIYLASRKNGHISTDIIKNLIQYY